MGDIWVPYCNGFSSAVSIRAALAITVCFSKHKLCNLSLRCHFYMGDIWVPYCNGFSSAVSIRAALAFTICFSKHKLCSLSLRCHFYMADIWVPYCNGFSSAVSKGQLLLLLYVLANTNCAVCR